MDKPAVEDQPVKCEKCDNEFIAYRLRIVEDGTGGRAVALIDVQNHVIYDLVLACGCGRVFHFHTKEQAIVENSQIYRTAWERLARHYAESAIIKDDNSSG